MGCLSAFILGVLLVVGLVLLFKLGATLQGPLTTPYKSLFYI